MTQNPTSVIEFVIKTLSYYTATVQNSELKIGL